MSTLDMFLGIKLRCSDCGAVLDEKPQYKLNINGRMEDFCRDCARKRLPKPRPKESEQKDKETACINSLTVFRRSRER